MIGWMAGMERIGVMAELAEIPPPHAKAASPAKSEKKSKKMTIIN